MRGYWQDEDKSRQAFARFNGKVYYKTGDLCSVDPDGDIIYRGRKDYQVKVQGFRVELSEIEYRTKKFFPNETNAVVVPKKEDDGGCQLHLVRRDNSPRTGRFAPLPEGTLTRLYVTDRSSLFRRIPVKHQWEKLTGKLNDINIKNYGNRRNLITTDTIFVTF